MQPVYILITSAHVGIVGRRKLIVKIANVRVNSSNHICNLWRVEPYHFAEWQVTRSYKASFLNNYCHGSKLYKHIIA